MADAVDNAEKAYAEASAEAKPVAKPAAAKADAKASPEPKKAEPKTKAATEKAAPKTKAVAKKPAPKKAAAKAPKKKTTRVGVTSAAKRKARVAGRKPAAKPIAAQVDAKSLNELKEKIMAKKTEDFTKTMTTAMTEMQDRAKSAYEKSTEFAGEATEFAKGNVEAVVESGKILSGGMQDMGATVVAEAKSAYKTMTADMKEMAAVKSPTDLFQLQGAILRRNFDAMVQASSKNTEAAMKLANDAFAPISARANVAADKLAKVAA
ncbi:phasin family protein [Paraurantiacibacter namhicola]|uniref:Phasin protein n=1 Tax=Paraurantiacibacter namhicola TaxID=645517 RepID=A0A1C7DBS8_9SPHN|nr:phasin family protein [Paraurantiacibacter namhicola]ANU08771.1 Phasin protein [Paraurantiacibacter namhicola]